jgi:ribosomal protein L11 methyltransferase
MHPELTYELRIEFVGPSLTLKPAVATWLSDHAVDSFVEGVVDDLYVDHDYDNPTRDFYEEFGGAKAPISVFKYSDSLLRDLAMGLADSFGENLKTDIISHKTEGWMEGWKESFKPITTSQCYIYPPWLKDNLPQDKHLVEIEPGMAFGTGQHATTILCLSEIERLSTGSHRGWSIADVGTGTAILAIAAKKLGYAHVVGTDIDEDAITAAHDNASRNNVELELSVGSAPVWKTGGFDLVVANILTNVLKKILPSLAQSTKAGGLLLLSGLLVEHEEELTEQAIELGLALQKKGALEGWSSLLFVKPTTSS